MGVLSSAPELSLDLKLKPSSFVPETINGFLRQVWRIGDESQKIEMVDQFLKRLEEEMKKIQVFERELPLSMLLLNDAILVVKQESTKKRKQSPDTEKKRDDADSSADKKDWMSSVQLWTPLNYQSSKESDDDFAMIHDSPEIKTKVDKEDVGVPGLPLLIPQIKHPNGEYSFPTSGLDSKLATRVSSSSSPPANANANRHSNQQSASRKRRRCWSPELHRRFVDALTQLGGPQVATPKQIRELMRVDGLTNDEVKSHLQKYRLHARRVPNNSATSTNDNENGTGSSWATHDQCSDSSKPSKSQSDSPQGPLQFPGVTGMEDEDEKSESYSWIGQLHRPGKDDV